MEAQFNNWKKKKSELTNCNKKIKKNKKLNCDFFFFFRDNYNILLTHNSNYFPLVLQALCAWGNVNSSIRPLAIVKVNKLIVKEIPLNE